MKFWITIVLVFHFLQNAKGSTSTLNEEELISEKTTSNNVVQTNTPAEKFMAIPIDERTEMNVRQQEGQSPQDVQQQQQPTGPIPQTGRPNQIDENAQFYQNEPTLQNMSPQTTFPQDLQHQPGTFPQQQPTVQLTQPAPGVPSMVQPPIHNTAQPEMLNMPPPPQMQNFSPPQMQNFSPPPMQNVLPPQPQSIRPPHMQTMGPPPQMQTMGPPPQMQNPQYGNYGPTQGMQTNPQFPNYSQSPQFNPSPPRPMQFSPDPYQQNQQPAWNNGFTPQQGNYPFNPAYNPNNQQYKNPPWNQGGYNQNNQGLPDGLILNSPESQVSYSYLTAMLSGMLNDPNSREALLLAVTDLKNILNNPNALKLIQAYNAQIQDTLNNPNKLNQLVQQPTSTTIVQTAPGGGIVSSLMKKGGILTGLLRNVALAKSQAVNELFDDIPVVNTIVRMGTGFADSGFKLFDSLGSSFQIPSSGTTVTTVRSPTSKSGLSDLPWTLNRSIP